MVLSGFEYNTSELPSKDCSESTQVVIIPEAIDFHCFPQMVKMLHYSYPNESKASIKKAIWFGGSRLNVRKEKRFVENEGLPDNLDEYIVLYKKMEKQIRKIRIQLLL